MNKFKVLSAKTLSELERLINVFADGTQLIDVKVEHMSGQYNALILHDPDFKTSGTVMVSTSNPSKIEVSNIDLNLKPYILKLSDITIFKEYDGYRAVTKDRQYCVGAKERIFNELEIIELLGEFIKKETGLPVSMAYDIDIVDVSTVNVPG